MKRLHQLTVEEIEPNNGAITEPPEVNWFTLPQNRISQGHKVTDGGTRPNILQVRSSGTTLTISPEILELSLGRSDLGVQFTAILIVELSRDGLVDVPDHRVLPERVLFVLGVETGNISRAGDHTRSANYVDTTA